MTQHVRKGYRNHRKATWAAAVTVASAAVLAALALVLPALGAAGDLIPPSSLPQGITPTDVSVGGSNFDCTTNTGGVPAALKTFTVSSPPNSATPVVYNSANTASTPTPLPAGVTFTLTGVNGANKGKFFSFQAAGSNGVNVSVFHVGVKGGNDVAWYNYFAKFPAGVQYDGTVNTSTNGIHATLKDATNLYNASYTTFCYTLTTTISGKVFLDNSADGSFNTSATPPDAGLNGWTVKLFNTSSSPAVQVGSLTTPTTSSDAGSYTFTGVPMGSNYAVCVQQPAGDSGTYDQTVPTGNTACSSVTGALPSGQVITNLQAAATGNDFGVEQTVTPSCTTTFSPSSISSGSQIVDYTAQMTNPSGGSECKDAVVMYTYDANSKSYAVIHPTAGAGTDTYWVVERIRMKVSGGAQNPVTLKYDDTNPYGDSYATMKMCLSDPRTAGQEFALATNPADSSVMPAGETSCMIQSTDFPSGNTYNYEAYIATDVDGIKVPVQ